MLGSVRGGRRRRSSSISSGWRWRLYLTCRVGCSGAKEAQEELGKPHSAWSGGRLGDDGGRAAYPGS